MELLKRAWRAPVDMSLRKTKTVKLEGSLIFQIFQRIWNEIMFTKNRAKIKPEKLLPKFLFVKRNLIIVTKLYQS